MTTSFQINAAVIMGVTGNTGFIYSMDSGERIELASSVGASTPCTTFTAIVGNAKVSGTSDPTNYEVRTLFGFILLKHPMVESHHTWVFYNDNLKPVNVLEVSDNDTIETDGRHLVHLHGRILTVYDNKLTTRLKCAIIDDVDSVELMLPNVVLKTPIRCVSMTVNDLVDVAKANQVGRNAALCWYQNGRVFDTA